MGGKICICLHSLLPRAILIGLIRHGSNATLRTRFAISCCARGLLPQSMEIERRCSLSMATHIIYSSHKQGVASYEKGYGTAPVHGFHISCQEEPTSICGISCPGLNMVD